MGYLPYLMIGNFDDKPLDFMFFPLLFSDKSTIWDSLINCAASAIPSFLQDQFGANGSQRLGPIKSTFPTRKGAGHGVGPHLGVMPVRYLQSTHIWHIWPPLRGHHGTTATTCHFPWCFTMFLVFGPSGRSVSPDHRMVDNSKGLKVSTWTKWGASKAELLRVSAHEIDQQLFFDDFGSLDIRILDI